MINASSSSSRLLITALVLVALLLPLSTVPSMAESTTKTQEAEEATVQIVFVAKLADEDPEAFHIRTLAAVLGSEKAAEDNVIYHYKHASSGFSAKLTKLQVEELLKQPGVLQVVPDRTLTLHGSGNTVGTVRPTRLL